MAKSVVLLSGGLDSAANLALCREKGQPVLALTVRYGQRAQDREVAAAQALSVYYDVRHEVVEIPWLGNWGGSALTDPSHLVPTLRREELDQMAVITETARAVWVPNRNGILIHIAAARAESLGADRVVVGFNREEATTFPDNSLDYLNRATAALALSTANQVQVSCYTVEMDKRQIVAELRKLSKPFPFEKLWSCYHGGEKPCGHCESCQRLARVLA